MFDFQLDVGALNVLIGANASGKTTVLDALAFLHEGCLERDFSRAIGERRGGILHLAWKGEEASDIDIETVFTHEGSKLVWKVALTRRPKGFSVKEHLTREPQGGGAPRTLLQCSEGKGFWWSEKEERFPIELSATSCALGEVLGQQLFPGRNVAAFVESWEFLDPDTQSLRRASRRHGSNGLAADGSNLAARLMHLKENEEERFKRIIKATKSILGLPREIKFHVTPEDRVYFTQLEEGNQFPVHQVGASSGTLRLLALCTALLGGTSSGLVAIEEPESHLHPTAVNGFVQLLKQASTSRQILITTHWPDLINALGDPEAVCIVRRGPDGTKVERPGKPDLIRTALEKSGLALGEYLQSKGFGA